MSYSDNSIMAKVQAKYGQRLREDDYNQLISCKSVSEITSLLKNKPAYKSVLSQVQEDLIHRGQLEALIHRRVLDIYSSLAKYSHSDWFFVDIYIKRRETEQLLLVLRLLNAGLMDKYIVELPANIAKYMSFDLFKIAGIKSFGELLEALEHTEYHNIIADFEPQAGAKVDIAACERELLINMYDNMLKYIGEKYSGKTQDSLKTMLRAEIGLHNLSVIYRLKIFFKYSPAKIRDYLLPIKSTITGSVMEKLLDADTAADIFEIAKNTFASSFLSSHNQNESVSMIHNTEYLKFKYAKRTFRFSADPVVVVIAYMQMLNIELSNLVNIIEGIRYNLPGEEIKAMLVLPD